MKKWRREILLGYMGYHRERKTRNILDARTGRNQNEGREMTTDLVIEPTRLARARRLCPHRWCRSCNYERIKRVSNGGTIDCDTHCGPASDVQVESRDGILNGVNGEHTLPPGSRRRSAAIGAGARRSRENDGTRRRHCV